MQHMVKSSKIKKINLKVVLISAFLLIAFASSISVEKLDEVRARASNEEFDAALYAERFWEKDLMPNLSKSVEISKLINLLQEDPETAFKEYSEALGIGNIRFFMVRGEGEILNIGEDDITVLVDSDSLPKSLEIETEYIFGNAVRDASGKVDLQEFEQTMDFNMVSAEINKLVREKVLPPLKAGAEVGRSLRFVGAIELNKEQVNVENMEIIPVFVEFKVSNKEAENGQ